MTEPAFERVFTMTDFYDGPRGGIALFGGQAHTYASLYLDTNDSCAEHDVFELRPIDDETLALALEDWEIWLRWETAFLAGTTTHDTHPALPADRARHDEIAPILAERLVAHAGTISRARVEFRTAPGHEHSGRGRWLEARWTLV